jgi:hypothetical protein
MADTHRDLNITPPEWDAFMDDLQQTVDKFKVPASEQAELRAIVESTYDDIVVARRRQARKTRDLRCCRFRLLWCMR